MSALSVIKTFDVIEYIGSCVVASGILAPPGPLSLERRKETFNRRIVVATPATIHAANDAMPCE